METFEREHAFQWFNIKKGIEKVRGKPEGTSDHTHRVIQKEQMNKNELVRGSSMNGANIQASVENAWPRV